MGCYDCLEGEQVKIFYSPMFEKHYSEILDQKRSGTSHLGGLMRNFKKDDDLPLITGYYKYPQNFIVYDYFLNDLYIIENGKFKRSKDYLQLTENEIDYNIYDESGRELNINNLYDFAEIKNDYLNARRNIGTMDAFRAKWHKEDKYKIEKQFGEFIECYFYLKSYKDFKPIESLNYGEQFVDCKIAIQDFIKENDKIVEKYFAWVNDDDIINKEKLDKIINEIVDDNCL